jgi:hypothetical protein
MALWKASHVGSAFFIDAQGTALAFSREAT